MIEGISKIISFLVISFLCLKYPILFIIIVLFICFLFLALSGLRFPCDDFYERHREFLKSQNQDKSSDKEK